jgi:hypothetical protein
VQWPNLVGKVRIQPLQGAWHLWKQAIADHCAGQCVYCAIPEGRFGGIRNFHIEHFRPKSKFPKLENHIGNLYLACAICNVLKSDDWPAEPIADHSLATYPDPFHTDYNTLFVISSRTYEVGSSKVAGKYLIEKILLNRAQLILERRLAALLNSLSEFDAWVSASLRNMTKEELKTTVAIVQEISRVKTKTLEARPYRDVDTKRSNSPKRTSKRPNAR